MNENELEIDGVMYIARVYTGSDCGHQQGLRCAFDSRGSCHRYPCAPDLRTDGRNVIFVEKH